MKVSLVFIFLVLVVSNVVTANNSTTSTVNEKNSGNGNGNKGPQLLKTPYDFGSRMKYFASGWVYNFVQGGDVLQPKEPETFAIDGPNKLFNWNLNSSQYFLRENGAYFTSASLPGVCFEVKGRNFDSEVEGWSFLRLVSIDQESSHSRKKIYQYAGKALDVWSCCDYTGSYSKTDETNKIKELVSQQLFPSLIAGSSAPLTASLVTTLIQHNSFRSLRRTDFPFPNECRANTIDFCASFYVSEGFCLENRNLAVPYHL
jgi:hypothetical protein